jgi:hypothetical protein
MDALGFGQHLVLDHQRRVRRAEARERLSVEEQAAYGLLDDNPARVRAGQGWRRGGLGALVAAVVARLGRCGVGGRDEAGARQPL